MLLPVPSGSKSLLRSALCHSAILRVSALFSVPVFSFSSAPPPQSASNKARIIERCLIRKCLQSTMRQIRAHERKTGGHLPIAAMTANAFEEDRRKCLEAGMDGYVAKPVSAEAVFKEIRRVIAANRERTANEPLAGPRIQATEEESHLRNNFLSVSACLGEGFLRK